MADLTVSPSRRGVIGAVAALPALALSLAGAPAIAAPRQPSINELLGDVISLRDHLFAVRLRYADLPACSILAELKEAQRAYDLALEDLFEAGEAAGLA